MVHPHRQQMVHHLEPLVALRIIHAAQVDERLEVALLVIPQEAQQRQDMVALGQHGQFAHDNLR